MALYIGVSSSNLTGLHVLKGRNYQMSKASVHVESHEFAHALRSSRPSRLAAIKYARKRCAELADSQSRVARLYREALVLLLEQVETFD